MRFPLIVLAFMLAFMSISSSAFAGAPDWKGYTGLVDKDGDGYPAFVGISTATSTGYSGSVDCSGDSNLLNTDKHATVYPGAIEIVADGIDQDCNGKDLVLPVSQAAWILFVKNEYSGTAPSASRFVYEFDQCTAASGKCEVDKIDGRFRVTDDGVKLMDIYVNGTEELRNNGQKADGREIVTIEKIQHYRGGSASGGGLGTKAVIKIAEDKAAAAVKIEADQRIAGQLALADSIATLTEEDTRIVELIGTEEARAVEAERLLREDADKAQTDAAKALDLAQKRGVLVEGYALTGLVVGSPVNHGDDVARNAIGGGFGAGLNLGLDHESGRVNAFADAILGADGGAGPVHSEAIGLEIIGKKGWGGFAAYSVRSSQPNSLETQVLGRNPLVGVSFVHTFSPNESTGSHGLFQVHVGGGPEWVAIAGDSDVTDEVGFAGRLTVSIGGGIGALK